MMTYTYFFIFLVFLFPCLGTSQTNESACHHHTTDHHIMHTVQKLIKLTNIERTKRGIPPLEINPKLMQIAKAQAEAMAKSHKLSHNLEGNISQRAKKEAYHPYLAIGENIHKFRGCSQHVIDDWMNSPKHRGNILNSQFKEIGIGIGTTCNGTRYIAQFFGTRQAAQKN